MNNLQIIVHKTTPTTTALINHDGSTSKSPSEPSSSFRQPRRIFTPQDEINLLQSLLNSGEKPTCFGHFTEAQITNKIRRLKQNYIKMARNESSIMNTRDCEIYKIAQKIWGKEKPRITYLFQSEGEKKEKDSNKRRGEDVINWNNYPFLMKNVSGGVSVRCLELYKEGLKGLGEDVVKGLDERWRELEMEKIAIESRRAQLYHKHQLESIGRYSSK